LLVDNPIDRYAIGDRTEGLKLGEDGSLTIHFSSEEQKHGHPGVTRSGLVNPTHAFTWTIHYFHSDDQLLSFRRIFIYTQPII
jgi:hypothetical protein